MVNQTPRWSNENRLQKANAVFETIRLIYGDEIKNKQWLDIGCGSGSIASQIAQHVTSIDGYDPEPWPQWEQLKNENTNLGLKVGFFDQHELPVINEKYDIVICNQVYEHVENLDQLIANIYKVLKEDGVCYFAGPNLLWPIEPHVFYPFVHWLPRGFAQSIIHAINKEKILDANSKNVWQITKLFKKHGFTYQNSIHYRIAANHKRFQPYIDVIKIISDLLIPFTPGFIFVLTKR